jgi:hypothetical protein
LGYRELRHLRFYQGDPMVKRVFDLTKLPDVTTISLSLSSMDDESTNNLQRFVEV